MTTDCKDWLQLSIRLSNWLSGCCYCLLLYFHVASSLAAKVYNYHIYGLKHLELKTQVSMEFITLSPLIRAPSLFLSATPQGLRVINSIDPRIKIKQLFEDHSYCGLTYSQLIPYSTK